MTVHDLHATMLKLLGIDHLRFSVKFQGLDARLSGVEPCRVVTEILAWLLWAGSPGIQRIGT